ncbi:ATP-binding protein [Eggerthellaceae bacterium 3-80]|nr:ATP-binding protein [bacterium D16-34]
MADEKLERFLEDIGAESHLRVEADLGDGFVRLRSSEAERRQAAQDIRSTEDIIIEMLRNARDASAQNIYVALSREGQTRRITMLDDGDGIPVTMHERVFEPRVTSKLDSFHMDKWGVHGRGMALYSISVNAQKARVVCADPGKGSSIFIETCLTNLPEKVDQSTFPLFIKGENDVVSVRGPRNILRTSCEFALESRKKCSVYVGSPIEIAATLYARGLSQVNAHDRVLCPNEAELAVCDRLALATDPDSFADLAAGIGLYMSSRSARRIQDGEISPLAPLLEKIRIVQEAPDKGLKCDCKLSSDSDQQDQYVLEKAFVADRRGLKIAQDDMDCFKQQIEAAFQAIARDYYLEGDVDCKVTIRKDALHISIPLEKLR